MTTRACQGRPGKATAAGDNGGVDAKPGDNDHQDNDDNDNDDDDGGNHLGS
jgi:hypothetical protein